MKNKRKVEEQEHLCAHKNGVHKIKDCPKKEKILAFLAKYNIDDKT